MKQNKISCFSAISCNGGEKKQTKPQKTKQEQQQPEKPRLLHFS